MSMTTTARATGSRDAERRRGRDGPFADFVAARTPSLLRSAFLLTGDQQLAEDLVQDALARTYQAWNRLQRTGNAAAYTRRTMYHLQVSRWRRRRVAERLSDAPPETAAPGRDVDLELTVHAALLRLPAGQRAAVILRFVEDLTESDIAEVLGCSRSSVRTRVRRGLTTLRTLVPEIEEVP